MKQQQLRQMAVIAVMMAVVSLLFARAGGRDWVDVHIHNRLGEDRVMTVHCKSKQEDLGIHTVYNWYQYSFALHVNFWGTTLFFCYVSRPDKVWTYFDAYNRVRDRERCVRQCLWHVQMDGIYGFNTKVNNWEKVYTWNRTTHRPPGPPLDHHLHRRHRHLPPTSFDLLHPDLPAPAPLQNNIQGAN